MYFGIGEISVSCQLPILKNVTFLMPVAVIQCTIKIWHGPRPSNYSGVPLSEIVAVFFGGEG